MARAHVLHVCPALGSLHADSLRACVVVVLASRDDRTDDVATVNAHAVLGNV